MDVGSNQFMASSMELGVYSLCELKEETNPPHDLSPLAIFEAAIGYGESFSKLTRKQHKVRVGTGEVYDGKNLQRVRP
jgi:hypothetical protein